jgi:rhodanese-related sulfurtransferase
MILEFAAQKRGNLKLSPLQLVQLMNRNNAVVIDIRQAPLFAEGHIIDAISMPAEDIENKLKKIEKYKSKPVVLTCLTGNESPRTAAVLAKNGFENIHVLNGGIRAWRDADMPLVKE